MARLDHIRHFALDLDGTLYLGDSLFPWTPPFLDLLKQKGIGRTFFTNNSSRSTRQYVQKLNKLGLDASPSDIYSSTTATLDYLRRQHPGVKRIFLLGTVGLAEEFLDAGYRLVPLRSGASSAEQQLNEPEAVVIGFDTSLSYPRVCEAAYWIAKGKLFVATHCDLTCPTDEPTVLPDCGAICQMLTAATGRAPDAVLGKPHPSMLAGVMQRHRLRADQLAVVGDRLYTDMAMARSAGAMGILVLSGETKLADVERAKEPPDLVVANVGELSKQLESVEGAL